MAVEVKVGKHILEQACDSDVAFASVVKYYKASPDKVVKEAAAGKPVIVGGKSFILKKVNNIRYQVVSKY